MPSGDYLNAKKALLKCQVGITKMPSWHCCKLKLALLQTKAGVTTNLTGITKMPSGHY
jgi:hypothetical protein